MELLLFVFSLSGLCAWALLKDTTREHRDSRQQKRIAKMIGIWTGKPIADVDRQLGAPFEVVDGLSGRSLHVWRCPPNRKLPRGSGVVVLTLTVSEAGVVEGGEWKRWGI